MPRTSLPRGRVFRARILTTSAALTLGGILLISVYLTALLRLPGAQWNAFGWNVLDVDGHDFDQICGAIEAAHEEKERPTVIIAQTIKGKGVDFMENQASWHYGGLDEAMQEQALESLGKE